MATALATPVNVLTQKTESLLHPESVPATIHTHGNQAVREHVLRADSADANGCTFSTTLNPKTLLDREILLRCRIQVSLVDGTDMISMDTINGVAPASDPLARIMKSATLTLNNASKSFECSAITPALNHFRGGDEYHAANFGLTQPDPFNTIDRIEVTDPPFKPSGYGQLATRGDYPWAFAYANNGKTVTKTYEFVTPLHHPFLGGRDESLANVTSLRLSIVWNNLKGAILNKGTVTSAGGATVTPTVDFPPTYKPELLFRSIAPSVDIPQTVTVPANDYLLKRVAVGSTTYDTTASVESGNITLSQVPNRIFIWVGPQNDIVTMNQPNFLGGIESLTMRTQSNSGGFTGATSHQLWQMSKRNGSSQTYTDFSDRQGSVVCIDVSEDVGGWVAGVREQMSMDFSLKFRNVCHNKYDDNPTTARVGDTHPFSMYILFEMDGRLSLDASGQAMTSGGTALHEVVKSLEGGGFAHSSMLAGHGVGGGYKIGGGFWKSFRKGFMAPLKVLNQLAPALSLMGPEGRAVANAAMTTQGLVDQLK